MGTLSVDKLLKTSAGAATFTLPATDGTAGQVWQTDGAGQLSVAALAADTVTATQIAANAVTTTEIIDNAVTGAKIAMGSDAIGDLLYYNGTDYVRLAAGTSAQVLTSAGAAAPTWSAAAASGKVLQVVQVTKTDIFTTSSTSFVDVTDMTASITPASSSNKVLIMVNAYVGNTSTSDANSYTTLVRDSTEIFIGDADGNRIRVSTAIGPSRGYTGILRSAFINYLDSPSTTSATTYKIQARIGGGGTFTLGKDGDDSNDDNEGRTPSSIILMEIGA